MSMIETQKVKMLKTECEAEIKSLKQELSKLKSDLATCQSQMEFGDEDFDPLL